MMDEAAPPGIRIVSDGTTEGTSVYLDDSGGLNVTEVTWKFSPKRKVTAVTIEITNVEVTKVEIAKADTEQKPPPPRRKARRAARKAKNRRALADEVADEVVRRPKLPPRALTGASSHGN